MDALRLFTITKETFADIIGNVAGLLMLMSFCPQIYEIITSKTAIGLSFPFAFLLFIVSVLYLIYGILIDSWPLILTNIVGTVLTTIIVGLKLHYDHHTFTKCVSLFTHRRQSDVPIPIDIEITTNQIQ
jgi:MtN3 and saliva related transmembrane protein